MLKNENIALTGRPKALFSEEIHHWIYFVCLCILVASMPTSRFIMSLIQILMGVNWLLEGNYREKVNRFMGHKAAFFLMMLYVLHAIGLIWSEDIAYGLGKDMVDKLPMLTLTFLVVSSRPLSVFQVRLLLYLFFSSVVVTSLIGFYIYITGNYNNFRDLSPFISHVYLSMMVIMTIFTLPWLTIKITQNKKWIALSVLVSLWLVIFLFILRSMTGLLCFGGVIAFMVIRQVMQTRAMVLRISGVIVLLLMVSAAIFASAYMYRMVSHEVPVDQDALDDTTALGNTYHHDFDNPKRENGHYVFAFIAQNELRQAWNQRSEMDFDGEDIPGNQLRATLYRYMASRGLKKDSEGLQQLTDEEINAVERGVPNYLYLQWPGFVVRFHQIIWEIYWYRERGDPTGHSFTQRLELWRGSWVAFQEKPLLGWGTGDIFIAVRYGLEKIASPMENYHMKPHNQYLLFLLTLGIAGSILLYGFYFMFVMQSRAYQYLPFNIFLVILLVSMIANNPIDAQAGQTFFTFFSLYFGFLYRFAR